jgi:hypothetical protein
MGDSKVTQRKSWVVTHTPNNSSSNGVHVLNRLSCERLKRDSTPEFNSSYHYADENVEFDSPEPPNMINDEHSTSSRAEGKAEDFYLDVTSESNIVDLHSDPEPQLGTSRRDTYSLDNVPVVVEQNTPAPRRSILKCSKTAKPNRSRSSCRMVQFARLPNTDSRIKISKNRLHSGSNFIVSNNQVIDTNHSDDSKKDVLFDAEEFDDDLDGVQPLDSSVSSLINSPILDISNLNKSSKRGSRGNKVMSLVNSIEKRANESSIHSIRASDLLSMSGSKHNNTSPESNTIVSENSISSRRINLENFFEAEDSLKKISCNENENTIQNTDKSLLKNTEIGLVNNSDLQKLSRNLDHELSSDHIDDDKIQVECSEQIHEKEILTINDETSNCVSLNINEVSKTVENEISTIDDEMLNNISEQAKEFVAAEKEILLINVEKRSNISECVEELSSVEKEISTIDDVMSNNISEQAEEFVAVEKEMSTFDDEMPNNISENVEEHSHVENEMSTIDDEMPNNISENVEELSHVEKEMSTIDDEIPNNITENDEGILPVEKEMSTINDEMPNNITENDEGILPVEKEMSTIDDELPNNISENVEELSHVEKEMSTIDDEIPNNITENDEELSLPEKEMSTIDDELPNNISENVEELSYVVNENSIVEIDCSSIGDETSSNVSRHIEEEEMSSSCNDEISNVSKNINESKSIKKYIQNNVSKLAKLPVNKEKDHFNKDNNLEHVQNLSGNKRKHSNVQNVLEIVKKPVNVKKSIINVPDSVVDTAEKCNEDLVQIDIQNSPGVTKKSFCSKKKHLDVQNVSEIVKKLINVTKVYSNSQNDVSKHFNLPIDQSSSIIAPFMPLVPNSSIDTIGATSFHLNENVSENNKLLEKDQTKSLKNNELSYVKKESSTENINNTIMNAIESQLSEIDSDKSTCSNFNEKETIYVASLSSLNNEDTLLSNSIAVEGETDNIHLEINENVSLNSINSSSYIESLKDETATASNLITSVKDNINVTEVLTKTTNTENGTININNTNNLSSSLIRKSICHNNKSIELSEAIGLDILFINKDGSDSQNSVQNKTTIFSESKRSPITKKSLVLDKSNKLTKNTLNDDPQNNEISSAKTILCLSSDSKDLEHETSTNLEQTFDASIGKPKFESTPWNGSKSSKIIQPDLYADVSENNQQQRKRSRSITPLNDLEYWSQMMRDFNESVKKASYSESKINFNTCNQQSDKCKIATQLTNPLNRSIIKKTKATNSSPKNTPKSSNVSQRQSTRSKTKCTSSADVKKISKSQLLHPTIIIGRDDINKANNKLMMKDETKFTQKATKSKSDIITTDSESECNSNNRKTSVKSLNISGISKITRTKRKLKSYTSPQKVLRSSENDKSPVQFSNVSSKRISTRNKKKSINQTLPKDILSSSSENENSSNSGKSSFKSSSVSSGRKKLSSPIRHTRRNLRTRMNKNESNKSIKKQTRSNTIDKDKSSKTSNPKVCPSESATELHAIRNSEYSLNNKSTEKDNILVKPKKKGSNIEINTRKNKVTEKSLKNKSPIMTRITRSNTTLIESNPSKLDKKNKTSSPVKDKSSEVVKTIQNSKSNKKGRSKRILPSEPINKYTSECESSDNEEIIENLHSVNNPTIKNKEKCIQSDNHLSLSSTKRNLRERVCETSNVIMQLSTRSRKRNADISPFSQPIAKSKKCNNSSKVASTTISCASKSPQNHLSTNTKRTRQISKITATQDFDNSTKETLTGSKKVEKSKSAEKTRAKKRVINSEDNSIDLAPSTRKIIKKETEKKLTRATSKNSNTDEAYNSTKVKFDK